jgi:hypothetical protein
LADALVHCKDRNTIVRTLQGFRRYVLNEAENVQITMNVSTNQDLDDMFRKFRNGQVADQ